MFHCEAWDWKSARSEIFIRWLGWQVHVAPGGTLIEGRGNDRCKELTAKMLEHLWQNQTNALQHTFFSVLV